MKDPLKDDWQAKNLFKFAKSHFEQLEWEENQKWEKEKDITKRNRIFRDVDTYDYLGQIIRVLQLAMDSILETQNQIEKLANSLSKVEGSSTQFQKELAEIKNQINKKRGSILNKLKKIGSEYELKSFEVGAPGLAKAHFEKKR